MHSHIQEVRPACGRTGPTGGFTMIESLMAATFLAVLFLMVVHTSSRAADAYDEGSLDHLLTTEAHRGLERITASLELAESAVLNQAADPDLGADTLTFRVPIGFAGGGIQWGPTTRIGFELDPGETRNGLDDDGDGFVDEGRVVWTENPGLDERSVTLVPRVAGALEGEIDGNNLDDNGNGLVDERGLAFAADGGVLTVRMTCQRRDESGRVLTKTVETAIRVRN